MTQTMRAVEVGSDESLKISTLERPEPKGGEVLLRVKAFGVNRGDLLQRKGFYPSPKGASPLMGLEACGVVEAVGPDADRWSVGDRVCCIVPGGGYAEYAVVDSGSCLPLPDDVTFEQGASLAETMMTVWTNVFDVCALKRGETFLVHGGTSGIGASAIQMAKAWGCKVLTTAGSKEKCIAAETFGADRAINYKEEDFVEIAKAEGGVDVILDMVGGDYVAKNMDILNRMGRLVNIAYMSGSKVELNMMPVMIKRLTITGSTLRARSAEEKRQVRDGLERDFWHMLGEDKINPVVFKVFELEEIEAAHELMQSSQHIGKIVVRTGA
ncbi:NAD(P)H-quinone oxidoreductase [Ponticaulis profundi]|uniref:NAD(P)H-quinone oxidoreductase n=1 Tax=Ponticaulis profundi TaxID=2665222 RepID=A0ABW1S7D7_9PROT